LNQKPQQVIQSIKRLGL